MKREAQGLGAAALIGLDWGTSSLRSYRMDAEGQVLESRHLPWGVMKLPASGDQNPSREAGFGNAFAQACGDWLADEPELPVIACGMVGSAQGWKEAPYVELPCQMQSLAKRLTVLERKGGQRLHIVPGVIQRDALPNVMRGEETQVIGVLEGMPFEKGETVLVGLPGTHNKWVTVRDGHFVHFSTFMTGEVFALLKEHSILGRTMADTLRDDGAFARGLAVAASEEGTLGVLSNIFSCRSLGLAGALLPAAQSDYLSGLLIGHEMAALAKSAMSVSAQRIVLVGEADLCQRYAQGLAAYGLGTPVMAEQATVRGLWRLARTAGLVNG